MKCDLRRSSDRELVRNQYSGAKVESFRGVKLYSGPKHKLSQSFHHLKNPFKTTTPLIRPDFCDQVDNWQD